MIKSVDLLAIDVGNTSVAFGYFKNNTLVKTDRIITKNYSNPKINTVNKIIISSVVPNIDKILSELKPKPIFITNNNIPELSINIDTPSEAGADRIVNAFGTTKLYEEDCIIIDFGTATTVCLVKDATYQGGAIIAGIKTSLKALHQFTAKLPLLTDISLPKDYIGKNTKDSMIYGQYWSHVGALKEYIRLIKQDTPNAQIIATGGYANLFAKNIPEINIVEENLTLISLNLLGAYL